MKKFDYDTVPSNPKKRPYDGIPFNCHMKVAAVYTKNRNKEYNGNPLIEALPRPRNDEEITDAYSKSLLSYDFSEVSKMQRYEKISQIALLKDIRIKPPFAASIEDRFYLSQLISYKSRTSVFNISNECSMNCEEKNTDLFFEAMGSNPNEPITLLGYSGSGKSSAIETLLTDYPQVIEHNLDGARFIQITYLYVECPANSNMRTLLGKIAEQLDLALEGKANYKTMVKKARDIGAKASIISAAFKACAVGTLFLDEIQNIDFNLTKESSYATLLNISNETGVNVSVIGTEEAYEKMFKTLKLMRRVGDPIIASEYCRKKKYASTAISAITRYQWFDNYVTYDAEMIKAMYECTGGIFDQIVTLHTMVNLDYIEAPEKKKPTINAEYIYKVSERHFPRIRALIDELEEFATPEADKALHDYALNALEICNRMRESAKQDQEAESVIEDYLSDEHFAREDIIKNCIHNIQKVTDDYTFDELEKEIKYQIRCCDGPMDEVNIGKKALKALNEKEKEKEKVKVQARRARKDEVNEVIKNIVLNSEYNGNIQGIGGK